MTRGIVVDSTARLTPADLEELSARCVIRVVDLTVRVGDDERPDSAWSPSEVCDALRAGSQVSTSMPSPDAFVHALSELAEAGVEDALIVTMSGAMSGTAEAAKRAAETSAIPVRVVDSQTVSAGVVGAVRVATQTSGMDVDSAAEVVATWCRTSTRIAFIPESLDQLQAGGRIGAAAALIGKALSIVPVLGLTDGAVVTRAKVRTRSKAVARLSAFAREAIADLDGSEGVEIVLLHSEEQLADANRAAHELMDELSDVGYPVESRVVSTVITAHVGPGTVGVVVQTRPGG